MSGTAKRATGVVTKGLESLVQVPTRLPTKVPKRPPYSGLFPLQGTRSALASEHVPGLTQQIAEAPGFSYLKGPSNGQLNEASHVAAQSQKSNVPVSEKIAFFEQGAVPSSTSLKGTISTLVPGGTEALLQAQRKGMTNAKIRAVEMKLQASEEALARAVADKQAAIEQAVTDVQAQLEARTANIAARNATIKNLQQQLASQKTSAEAAQSSEVAAAKAAKNAEKNAATAAIKAEYEQRLQQLESRLIERSTANAATKNAALRNLRSQMNASIRRVEAAKQAEIESAIQGAQREMKTAFEAQLAEARGELNPLRTQLNAITSAETIAKQQIEQLTANLAAARGITKSQGEQLTKSMERIQQLEGQLAEAQGRASELNATKQSRNAAELKARELNAELAKEKQIMQSRVNQLAKNSETMKSEVAKAKEAAEEEVMRTFDQALQNSKNALKIAEREAHEAKEFAARAKEDAIKELTEQIEAAKEELVREYEAELETAKKEAETLRKTINTVNKSSTLEKDLEAARKYIAELQGSKNAAIDLVKRTSHDELARARAEYESLIARARKNVENAKQLARDSEQEIRRLRQEANARSAVIVAPPKPPAVIVPPRPPVPNVSVVGRAQPGLLLQKIGKPDFKTNPMIVQNLEKKLERVDSTQNLFIIADSVSCRDLSKLIKDTTANINAYRAVEEGPETTLSDIGINLALRKREELKQQIMDHVLIAPTLKTIQTAILIYGTNEQIFEMFPNLRSRSGLISHRWSNPKMFLIDSSVIPGAPGGSKGLFAKYPRDPSFDRIPYNDLQKIIPKTIDFTYLQKIPFDYSYNSLMTTIAQFVRNRIENKTDGNGQIALIVQPNVMRDMYNSHVTNKEEKSLGPNQPYHCESWSTTFDLAANDKAITIKEIMLSPNQFSPGSLPIDSLMSYGKVCKWPYKSPLHGTRKRGGKRKLQTRRR